MGGKERLYKKNTSKLGKSAMKESKAKPGERSGGVSKFSELIAI